ncbi:MAG: hypothetical protein DMG09_13155 [Acidobacteria bacterium]|nr:MAG: hypothetical protein DMG09_13155 [Acidobacteriota bacterium]
MDAAGTLTTLHSFNRSDGSGPNGLIQASDGSFYGTTLHGGAASNAGTVFKMDAAATITRLHSFAGSDGSGPNGLIQASDGSFYGTTSEGGADDVGVVFRLRKTTGINELKLTLNAGGTGAISIGGTAANVRPGYATAAVDSGATPYGTAVFRLSQNGVIVSEAAVPASPPTRSARVFIDYRTDVPAGVGALDIYTGLAIAHRGASPAAITYTLRDRDAQIVATGHGSLGVGAHFAKFIHELRDVAPDFNLPASFPAATRFGSLEITSSQPVSVVALRLTTNQRGETLLTTTPIADLSASLTNSPVYFAQLADGRGFTTTLILLNTSNGTESGTLAIFDDNGAPLALSDSGGTAASAFPYSIPAGGAFVFQTGGQAALKAGWVKATPNPGTSAPAGAGVFSYSPAGILVTESGIPSAIPTTNARIYVDKSGGHDTGLAVANPGGSANSIVLQAFENNGSTTAGNGQAVLNIAPSGHSARFVGEMIGGLPDGFRGVVRISSASPFVAVTVRSLYNSRGDFLVTTFPIADANRPAPGPIVFPQIADGGGFTTEFIFISATGSATVTVNFLGDNGSPLSAAGVSP